DRDILPAVLAGIADPDYAAVGQPDPPRALDVKEEEVGRIGRVGDLEPPPRQRPVLDRRPVGIRDEIAALVDPAPAPRPGLRIGLAQIGRTPIDRHLAARLTRAAAPDLRLIIAGGEGGAVADH